MRHDIARRKQAGAYGEAVALAEKRFGRGAPNTSPDLDELGPLYQSAGRFPEAEAMLARALAIRQKAFGPDDIKTAITLNNLAELYRQQARYEDAEPVYKRSMTIIEKQFGASSQPLAAAFGNLGALYYAQGRYAEAEPLFNRSLAIREKLEGPEAQSVGAHRPTGTIRGHEVRPAAFGFAWAGAPRSCGGGHGRRRLLPKRNARSSLHIRCRTTASLRATATRALAMG